MNVNAIVITGASSGIGREFALQMDEAFNNIDVFILIGRNRKRLEAVAEELQNHACMILDRDITEKETLEELVDILRSRHAKVRMLINCAGYGIMGEFASSDCEEETGMIRVNCEALTSFTHSLLPFMCRGSRIIQMASSAAFVPQPDFAVYAATKAYVLSFSRALGEELRDKGIYVTSVCPGPVNTPFFRIAENGGNTLSIKKYTMTEPVWVVEKALRDSYYKHPVSVYGLPIQGFACMTKLLPHSAILFGMRLLKKFEK